MKAGKLEPGEVPDRAIMWKKARKRKDGTVDEDVEEICDKIVSFFFMFLVFVCFFYFNLQAGKKDIKFWLFGFFYVVDRMNCWKKKKRVNSCRRAV